MSASPTASIDVVCPHCGKSGADAQTGRCLDCGKRVVSPDIAAEMGHPILGGQHLGQARHSPSASYRGSTTPEPVAAAPALTVVHSAPDPVAVTLVTFRLPDSPATTKWIVETRALRDKLLAQAEKAELQIQELAAEAARNRESAAAFTHLLEGIAIDDGTAASTAGPSAAPDTQPAARPRGKWSKNADACVECHRSDLPHLALDRCRGCYDAKRVREGKS